MLLTHLHADHVGGVMSDGHAAFPNAVVRVSKRDADYWLDAAQESSAPALLLPMFLGAQKSLEPYQDAGRFQPFEDGAALLSGIRAVPSRATRRGTAPTSSRALARGFSFGATSSTWRPSSSPTPA